MKQLLETDRVIQQSFILRLVWLDKGCSAVQRLAIISERTSHRDSHTLRLDRAEHLREGAGRPSLLRLHAHLAVCRADVGILEDD